MKHHAITLQRQERLAASRICCLDIEGKLLVDSINFSRRQSPGLGAGGIQFMPLDCNAIFFCYELDWADLEGRLDFVDPLHIEHIGLEGAPTRTVDGHSGGASWWPSLLMRDSKKRLTWTGLSSQGRPERGSASGRDWRSETRRFSSSIRPDGGAWASQSRIRLVAYTSASPPKKLRLRALPAVRPLCLEAELMAVRFRFTTFSMCTNVA